MKNDIVNGMIREGQKQACRMWISGRTTTEKEKGRAAWYAIRNMMAVMGWAADFEEYDNRMIMEAVGNDAK